MKKGLSIFLVFIMAVTFFLKFAVPMPVYADDAGSGSCGNNVSWVVDNQVLTISGSGKIDSTFDGVSATAYPWNDYKNNVREIVIESGVENIPGLAFCNMPNLETVSIPDSVSTIESGTAFMNCRMLSQFEIDSQNDYFIAENGVLFNKEKTRLLIYPKGKTDEIFYKIPEGVTEADNCSIDNDTLRKVQIPSTFKYRSDIYWVFQEATELEIINTSRNNEALMSIDGILYSKQITELLVCPQKMEQSEYKILEGIRVIGTHAFFKNQNIKKVYFPLSLEVIGTGAFYKCGKLEYAEIPSCVREIGEWAFRDCVSLESATVPHNVKTLYETFYGCTNLKTVFLPAELESGYYVFSNTVNIENIYYSGSEENWNNIQGFEIIPTYHSNDVRYGMKWYQISFEANGGDLNPTTATILCGNKYGTLPTPNKDNQEFSGWVTNESGEGPYITADTIFEADADITIYAMWSDVNQSNKKVDNYSYSFSNSNTAFGYSSDYTIPLSSYQLIYGNNVRAEDMYLRKTYTDIPNKVKRTWDGSCAGMTATSEMLADSTNGINPVNFNASASVPRDLKVKDTFAELEIDLTAFIEAMHVAQYTQLFKDDRASTRVVTSDINAGRNNLNDFHNQIKAETEAGRPVLLAMMPGTGQGHAVLGYAVEDYEDGTSEIKIYDNRWPLQDLSMTLEKDSAGNYTSWAYDMDANGKEAYGVWGTELSGSNISFVYYDTIMEIWNTRGNLAENGSTNMLTINSDDFSLYSSNGKELARVENGELVKTSNDIDLMERELSLREEYEPDNVIVAPIAVYRVVNNDESIDTLEVSAANEDLGASISTTADEVVVAVQDSINYNSVTVCAEPEDTYSVSLKSTLNDDYNEIIAEGKGTEEEASISMINGVLDVEDCSLSSLVVDGEDKGPFTIKASAQTGGKISPSGETQSVKGENETYTITPNAGYVISDVLVDGKSIGAIAKYEFKNIDKDHTIEAKFKKTNLYGDATGDGQVDAKDLTSLARHLAKIEIIKDTDLFENSDVNHDGKVTAEDLTKLARFIAKIISSLD